MGHVVGPVPEVGHGEAGEATGAFADGHQVGEELARVEGVGEGVDHGDAAGRGHRLDAVLAEGPPHDRRALAGEHAGGVLDRLATAELGYLAVQDQGASAELGHADGEGHPGAGGGLVEQERDGPRTGQGPVGEAVELHRVGEVEHLEQLGG
jgi:hypothetical protein